MKPNLVFIALLLLVYSCKKKSPADPGNTYDPNKPSFRIGSKWTYVYTAYDQSGAPINSSEDEYKVVRDTTINGTKYFIDSYGTYFGYKSDGAYFFEKNNNREVLYFKYPAPVNATYAIAPAGPSCASNISITVMNTDTSYTYNTRSYDKLVYYIFNHTIVTCQGTGSTVKYLYSTKIGFFVYGRFANNNTTAYSTVELKSFTY